jgi:hypothetical protein
MNTHAKAYAAYASCFQLLENNYPPRRRQKLERQESLITLKIVARALYAVLASRGGKKVMSFFAFSLFCEF